MNINDWHPYLKYTPDGTLGMAQQSYEPLISRDGKTFCLNFDWRNKYRRRDHVRLDYTKEAADYFFERELKYLNIFKDKPYAPEIIEIDYKKKRVYIKWYELSCNQHIYGCNHHPNSWGDKIKSIILDQHKFGYYKITMYPHCHYVDNNDNMRTFDWYGTTEIANPVTEKRNLDVILNMNNKDKLKIPGFVKDDMLDLEVLFKHTLRITNWGNNSLLGVYKELFNE